MIHYNGAHGETVGKTGRKVQFNRRFLEKEVALPRTRGRGSKRAYANDNDALIPEIWAEAGVAILKSNMVFLELTHTDFKDEIANVGDTVNTRKPRTFKAYNKTDADPITVQDATSDNIAVKLDQHPHVSFKIKDGEQSMSMKDLIEMYIEPSMIALSEDSDSKGIGMLGTFLGTQAGAIGGLTSTNYAQYLTELAYRMDTNKCPETGRNLIVTPNMKRQILQNTLMVRANERGDQGTALRTANIGEIYGFEHYACQNAPSFSGGDDVTSSTFLINLAAGYVPGDSVLAVDTGTGALITGQWIVLGGKAYQITAHTETLGNTTSITISPALFDKVANNDPFTAYDPGAVNFVAGYAAGWSKAIVVDLFTKFPKKGQFVTFSTSPEVYVIVDRDSVAGTITLNRPLVNALADDDIVCIGPAGDYGFAFHRNATTAVIRALNLPKAGAGALGGRAAYGGLSLRIVMQYIATEQAHVVTCDLLMGFKQLDALLGAVLLG